MRYITKCTISEGRRLTTPLKERHRRSTAQSWFGQTRLQAIKWRLAVVRKLFFSLRLGEATKERAVSERKLAVDERVENGDGEWFNEKQCRLWCFYSPFHISSALLIGYCKVIPIAKWSSFALHACSSPVVEYFASPVQTFVQLERCASYPSV